MEWLRPDNAVILVIGKDLSPGWISLLQMKKSLILQGPSKQRWFSSFGRCNEALGTWRYNLLGYECDEALETVFRSFVSGSAPGPLWSRTLPIPRFKTIRFGRLEGIIRLRLRLKHDVNSNWTCESVIWCSVWSGDRELQRALWEDGWANCEILRLRYV